MIPVGTPAPPVVLKDQFNQTFDLSKFKGKHNVLILGYPADFTPTCSQEVPELEALAGRFLREANTVVVSMNADSRYTHAAWGADRGGISFPMLSDAAPHGGVSRSLGMWLPKTEETDRATVIVDRNGVVRYAETVGRDGRRNINQLLEEAKKIARADSAVPVRPAGNPVVYMPVGPKPILYAQKNCGHCAAVTRYIANLKMGPMVTVKYLDNDTTAMDEFRRLGARGTPAMWVPDNTPRGKVLLGAEAINDLLWEHRPRG